MDTWHLHHWRNITLLGACGRIPIAHLVTHQHRDIRLPFHHAQLHSTSDHSLCFTHSPWLIASHHTSVEKSRQQCPLSANHVHCSHPLLLMTPPLFPPLLSQSAGSLKLTQHVISQPHRSIVLALHTLTSVSTQSSMTHLQGACVQPSQELPKPPSLPFPIW